jgi:filamentous hemagglutinin family protein
LNKQYTGHLRLIPFLVFVFLVLLPFAYPPISIQAASPITASGLNTQVSPAVPLPSGQTQYNITGGTRPGGGTNLFHSFGDFNVPTNNIANFLNNSGLATSNILGRVTGGNLSNIFGIIQTTGFGNANLFLMNPAGFLFGPNATVNVGGMVSFTSADYLRLADGVLFNAVANANADAILSAAPVAAFGFLGSNPGAITVQGSQLSVTPGQSLSLVGGNITVQSGTREDGTVQSAKLSAQGGQINLASAVSAGELSAIDFTPAAGMAMGAINLSQKTALETSADAAGRVLIRGGQLMMDDASIKAVSMNGSGGPNPSPTILITAETVSLANGTYITAESFGSAPGGDITFQVGTLIAIGGPNRLLLNPPPFDFNDAGNLIANGNRNVTANGGPAGDITIEGLGGHGTAANRVLLKDSTLDSRPWGGTPQTRPSKITITADTLDLTNAGVPGGLGAATLVGNTLGKAPAGDLVLNVNHLHINVNPDETPIPGAQTVFIVTSNNDSDSTGPTGNILISGIRPESTDAAKLVAVNDALISTGSDGGLPQTAAGNITITTDTLSVSNNTGIFTTAFGVNNGGAPAGNISINVNTLRANTRPDGSLISGTPHFWVESLAFISSLSMSGQAGNLTISGVAPHTAAKQLSLNNLELNTVVLGGTPTTAPAKLTVSADSIHILNSTNIKTNTEGAAPAGDIVFNANSLLAESGSKITSGTSGPGPGGNIILNAGQSFTLTGGSSIIASSTGPGTAGNVTIQGPASPTQPILINGGGSGIFTNTEGSGAAGNILVHGSSVTLQNGGTLSATTAGTNSSGTGGTITVNADQVQVNSGGLITAATTGVAPGGSVKINANNTFSSNAATVSSTTTQAGGGGSINIGAGNSVTLTNGASVSASSTGQGVAGDININAGQNFTATNSSVTTEALHSSGGIIKITTAPNGTVQLTDSTISASVLNGSGGGGSINIDPQFVILENSQIISNSVFGPGGNINITTNLLLSDTASIISASSQFGQQGDIVIQSPISPASGMIIPLRQKPLIEAALVSQRCAAIAGGNISSFTVAGRDSLPAEPGGWISSPLAFDTTGPDGRSAIEANVNEPAEETPTLSLRRIGPPGFLTQAFATGSTACTL